MLAWSRPDPQRLLRAAAELVLAGHEVALEYTPARGDDAGVTAARARVQLAKTGLGERGTAWWEQDDDERRDRWETALRELDR